MKVIFYFFDTHFQAMSYHVAENDRDDHEASETGLAEGDWWESVATYGTLTNELAYWQGWHKMDHIWNSMTWSLR